jgi:hypothetical protein
LGVEGRKLEGLRDGLDFARWSELEILCALTD